MGGPANGDREGLSAQRRTGRASRKERPSRPPRHHGLAPRLHDLCLWRNRVTEVQKRVGWEMWVRMDKIMCAVLREAHEGQVEETMDALEEGPEGFYKSYLD